jgi:predicted O-methyltransferase YrrM
MLASLGCKLTSVDHEDRDAAQNLGGLNVTVIVKDAVEYLISTDEVFDLIVVDVHGNTPKDWARLKEPLLTRLKPGGKLVIDNVALYLIPEWKEETGVQWFLDQLPKSWPIKINTTVAPGVATVIKGPL